MANRGDKRNSEPVMPSKIEAFVPLQGHNPSELKSWAKRTGFVSTFSGETERSTSSRWESSGRKNYENVGFEQGLDLEKGVNEMNGSVPPKSGIDPILGRTRNRGVEIEPVSGSGDRSGDDRNLVVRGETPGNRKAGSTLGSINAARVDEHKENVNGSVNVNAHETGTNTLVLEQKKDAGNSGQEAINVHTDGDDPGDAAGRHLLLKMKCGPRDNPGYVPLILYGLQHYLSLAGSLIFIPVIIVPAMGGTDKDTATVISTMLLLSGISTILHTYFGTRLPLVQGSSFVYLAPALVIMNSRDFRNLTEHRFRHTMKELQGAIIIGSIFQCILGFSGLVSLLLRYINPIVVAPTVASVGLAFFSYGFPQAAACVEISLPEILLVLIFTLYLRGISIFGHRIFRIYAVPLSVVIIWAYAFFLTAGGAYNYKGCSPDVPSSNILKDACVKHAYTMKHCRTDVSDAMRTAAWVRIPYPLQWGIPIFRLRTTIIMIAVSLVASIDSIGTYHTASIRINAEAPTPGVVSRGIGIEGFCSVLAGLWGSGTGSTTLTENVHTVDITKVASRKVVEIGAIFLILFSSIGKVGAVLASIPQALAAAVLCFIWALVVALGLSALQYTQAASFRNMTIVGISLFLGLSIPAYFQQYLPESSMILPGYLIPYSAASDGPVHSSSKEFDFAVNGLLSMNMVVTFVIAFLLDNTVPGSRQERGVYIWSNTGNTDQSSHLDYHLPSKVSCCFRWAKCSGVQ